jgi:hypothetical protein
VGPSELERPFAIPATRALHSAMMWDGAACVSPAALPAVASCGAGSCPWNAKDRSALQADRSSEARRRAGAARTDKIRPQPGPLGTWQSVSPTGSAAVS